MTQRAKFYFKPSRYPSGEYWIVLEAFHEDLDLLANAFLGFDLREGTTVNQAEEIAAYLNENIRAVSYTTPKSAEAAAVPFRKIVNT
jgi:hypothetical protein